MVFKFELDDGLTLGLGLGYRAECCEGVSTLGGYPFFLHPHSYYTPLTHS